MTTTAVKLRLKKLLADIADAGQYQTLCAIIDKQLSRRELDNIKTDGLRQSADRDNEHPRQWHSETRHFHQ